VQEAAGGRQRAAGGRKVDCRRPKTTSLDAPHSSFILPHSSFSSLPLLDQTLEILFDQQLVFRKEFLARPLQHLLTFRLRQLPPHALDKLLPLGRAEVIGPRAPRLGGG